MAIQESRAYDHLYDPLMALASEKDHVKTFYRPGVALGDVPNHVGLEYHPPQGPDIPKDGIETLITGPHRYKYFRKPVVPFLHAVPPEVLLAEDRADGGGAATGAAVDAALAQARAKAAEDGIVIEDGKRTIAIQTLYRDGEAQTDAYTPDYVLKPGEPTPEILGLVDMKAGAQLPAGRAEVEKIERLRQRRDFEASLPPMTDEASFNVRRRMMEEQELLQWNYREQEVDEANEARMEALVEALEKREREAEFVVEQRVEDLQRRRLNEKEATLAAIQKRRIKALRKLGKARQTAERRVDVLTGTGSAAAMGTRGTRRDIIGDYANYGSSVYAPVARDGRGTDKSKRAIEAAVAEPADVPMNVPLSMTRTIAKRPKSPKPKTMKRKDRELDADLARVDTMLRTLKFGADEKPEDPLPAWRRKKERLVRPPTPTFDDVDESDAEDDLESAVTMLQKLIRGRATQNMMLEGKERRIELIRELQEEEDDAAEAERELAQHKAEQHLAAAKAAMLDSVQGEVMSATLDFLSKELVRMKEHARISDKVAKAEHTRRTREAEESGRRQAEEHLRLKQDVVYKQLARVHSQAAESLVDSLLDNTMEKVAAEEALRETKLRSSVLEPILSQLEASSNEGEVVVKDLVASFLLPEVERQRVQEQVELQERRFVEAARKTVGEAVAEVDGEVPTV